MSINVPLCRRRRFQPQLCRPGACGRHQRAPAHRAARGHSEGTASERHHCETGSSSRVASSLLLACRRGLRACMAAAPQRLASVHSHLSCIPAAVQLNLASPYNQASLLRSNLLICRAGGDCSLLTVLTCRWNWHKHFDCPRRLVPAIARMWVGCQPAVHRQLNSSCPCPRPSATVAHVIDKVLLPARALQQVLPYSQAVGGLAGGGSSAAITGAGSAGDAVSASLAAGGTGAATTLPGLTGMPGQAPVGQKQQCFRSIADAIAAAPSLSIVRSTLSLSGVSAQLPDWVH